MAIPYRTGDRTKDSALYYLDQQGIKVRWDMVKGQWFELDAIGQPTGRGIPSRNLTKLARLHGMGAKGK